MSNSTSPDKLAEIEAELRAGPLSCWECNAQPPTQSHFAVCQARNAKPVAAFILAREEKVRAEERDRLRPLTAVLAGAAAGIETALAAIRKETP